jgi:hypothetical protein
VETGKTSEGPGQEEPHSAKNLHAPEENVADTPVVKRKIKWPTANKREDWKNLDDDVDKILEATLSGPVDKKIQGLTAITYTVAMDRFGVQERRHEVNAHKENRRQREITELRQQLRDLTKRYRQSSPTEQQALADLRKIVREKLKSLRRAEYHRRRRKERARKRANFTKDPYRFMRGLLGEPKSGTLKSGRDEVEKHLASTYSCQRRQTLAEEDFIMQCPEPTKKFDTSEPKLSEVKDIVKRARASSAPGPSGLPYKLYKYCPKLLKRLWRLLCVIWRKKYVPTQWKFAEGCFVPKEENSEHIEQFRTISLLSVEGKIFFAVLARRTTSYLLDNKYIDTAVQKGGVPGISGCLEHTAIVTQLIREARENKGDLAVLWLDLANAYGSMPHNLVEFMMKRYHMPEDIQQLITNYYDGFRMRFTASNFTTSWQRLEVGIITGCTISVILFAAAMNLLAKSVEWECRGPKTNTGVRQPPIRAYMDDLTVTTTSMTGAKWILKGLDKVIAWADMRFKPTKSRSMVLKKGKVQKRHRFTMSGKDIPTINEKPVKSLGKVFDSSLSDKKNVHEMEQQLDTWLRKTDRSGLPGKFKVWIYQHGILPRILWPLLVYDVTLTTVETMERKVNSFLRRWLGIPKSFSSLGLYSTTTKLQLPIKAITEEYKVTKVRKVVQLRDSSDNKISEAGSRERTGIKWDANSELERVESRLRQKEIVGRVAIGRCGLGYGAKPFWERATLKERRELIQQEVRHTSEEERTVKAVSLKQQSKWMKWEGIEERKLSWNDLWRTHPQVLSFLLKAVYDVLPTPTNLVTWGITESAACQLCGGVANLRHVMSGCKKGLTDGRYRWRHDKVLNVIAEVLEAAIKEKRRDSGKTRLISFVKAGQTPSEKSPSGHGLLGSAKDWELKVDLGKQLKFPDEIANTALRPDVLLISRSSKQLVMIELTVPWEENVEEAHERKRGKYEELREECRANGWAARCEPVEVGCRGFAGRSLHRVFKALGIIGTQRKKAIGKITEAAEKASRWIWIKRSVEWTKSN